MTIVTQEELRLIPRQGLSDEVLEVTLLQEVFSFVGQRAMLNGSLHRTPPKESGNLGLVAVGEAICLRHQDA